MPFSLSMRILLIFIILCFLSKAAFANISLIRDSEIESFLQQLSDPLIKAANLQQRDVKIYIVNDDSINAFVAGGQNIFINTGLIQKFTTPDALIGVIAHEIGHIKAGHLVRASEGLNDAKKTLILSYLLGVGAIAAGSYDGGSALIMGGTHVASRMQQKYTRTQEEAADQYAIKFLDKINYPATGLINLLQYFASEFRPYADIIDEYALSHPISQKRIGLIKERSNSKSFSNIALNQILQPKMNVALAKLEGFTADVDFLLEKYQASDDNISKYILAISNHRRGNIKQAISLLNEIIESKNYFDLGFLYELRGQFLFEAGMSKESLISYSKAIKILSDDNSSLAKISFADAILASNILDQKLLELTLSYLLQAKYYEDFNPQLYLKLAKIYNKINKEGESYLALANYNLLLEEQDKAKKYASKAKEIYKANNNKSGLLRADDMLKISIEED